MFIWCGFIILRHSSELFVGTQNHQNKVDMYQVEHSRFQACKVTFKDAFHSLWSVEITFHFSISILSYIRLFTKVLTFLIIWLISHISEANHVLQTSLTGALYWIKFWVYVFISLFLLHVHCTISHQLHFRVCLSAHYLLWYLFCNLTNQSYLLLWVSVKFISV